MKPKTEIDLVDIVQRIRTSVLSNLTVQDIPDWIVKNTRLNGGAFSFVDHEYQLRILQSSANTTIIRKCSQIGLSELMARRVLALLCIMDRFDIILSFPTVDMVEKFTATRLNPVINDSPYLKSLLNPNVDSTTTKQIGKNFLHMRGTSGIKQAISTPADMIVNDEVDASDPAILTAFESRLTHSKYRWRMRFSTPTIDAFGISKDFDQSKKHWNMVKCCHCNHWFVPSYTEHVRLHGFEGDLLTLTKANSHKYDLSKAALFCPLCDKVPDLTPNFREWVVENPEEKWEADGFQVQPFDAPGIITVPDLLRAQINYEKISEFVNQNLGLPYSQETDGLTLKDLESCYGEGFRPSDMPKVMGVDMGVNCHAFVGGIDAHGNLHEVHREVIHHSDVKTRVKALAGLYRVKAIVMDTMPYTETVFSLQQDLGMLYGAVYITSKNLDIYTLHKKDEDSDRGLLDVRQVNVNRTRAFDGLMDFIQRGMLKLWLPDGKQEFIAHCLDMKRVEGGKGVVAWQKSPDGKDHWHHALLYCYVAMALRGLNGYTGGLGVFVGSINIKTL